MTLPADELQDNELDRRVEAHVTELSRLADEIGSNNKPSWDWETSMEDNWTYKPEFNLQWRYIDTDTRRFSYLIVVDLRDDPEVGVVIGSVFQDPWTLNTSTKPDDYGNLVLEINLSGPLAGDVVLFDSSFFVHLVEEYLA